MDEDIRTVAMLVRNQISYLTRERTRYQNKLAQQEQSNQTRSSQQSVSQIQSIGMQNQPPIQQVQMAVPQPFHNVPTQPQPEQITSQQKLHQEIYQQQVYQTQIQQMQMHLNQQVNTQASQFPPTQGFEGTDFQTQQLHMQVSQLQDMSSQNATMQQNANHQLLAQVQHSQIQNQSTMLHTQPQPPVVSHVHTQNISVATSVSQYQAQQQMLQTQKIQPQNQVMSPQYQTSQPYSQYQHVQSQNQSTQVSPPCYTSSLQQVLTDDNTVLSPDQFQNQNQQQGVSHMMQSMNGSLPLGSEGYQLNTPPAVIQNMTSSIGIPMQQTSNALTCHQAYVQDISKSAVQQNQVHQTQGSPQKILPQQIPNQLPNINPQQINANQCNVYTQSSQPQSPQKVISPSQNPPSNLPLSQHMQTPTVGIDQNQINVNLPQNLTVINPQQFQQAQSPAVQQPIPDNIQSAGSHYPSFSDMQSQINSVSYQALQDSKQAFIPVQHQNTSTVSQQTHFSPVDYANTNVEQESVDRLCYNQIRQDSVSRQPSIESDGLTTETTEETLPPSMSTSMTAENFPAGIFWF